LVFTTPTLSTVSFQKASDEESAACLPAGKADFSLRFEMTKPTF
jgi:hypothetical protein